MKWYRDNTVSASVTGDIDGKTRIGVFLDIEKPEYAASYAAMATASAQGSKGRDAK